MAKERRGEEREGKGGEGVRGGLRIEVIGRAPDGGVTSERLVSQWWPSARRNTEALLLKGLFIHVEYMTGER